jgi:hypothetical protein
MYMYMYMYLYLYVYVYVYVYVYMYMYMYIYVYVYVDNSDYQPTQDHGWVVDLFRGSYAIQKEDRII